MTIQEAIARLEGCHNIPMLFTVASELAEEFAGNQLVMDYLKDIACEILEGFEDDFLTEGELERARKCLFSRQVFTHGPMPEA
jgi:hypothetical protein